MAACSLGFFSNASNIFTKMVKTFLAYSVDTFGEVIVMRIWVRSYSCMDEKKLSRPVRPGSVSVKVMIKSKMPSRSSLLKYSLGCFPASRRTPYTLNDMKRLFLLKEQIVVIAYL